MNILIYFDELHWVLTTPELADKFKQDVEQAFKKKPLGLLDESGYISHFTSFESTEELFERIKFIEVDDNTSTFLETYWGRRAMNTGNYGIELCNDWTVIGAEIP